MRWLLTAYLVALHLALLWLLLPRLRAAPDTAPPQSFSARTEHGVRRARQAPRAAAVVGDSRVEDLAVSLIAPDAENYGVGGDTLGGITARLKAYDLSRARAVILAGGINEWPRHRFAGFADRYAAMLAAVPAGVAVLALELIPADETAAGPAWQGVNARLAEANTAIRAACAARPGCRLARQPFGATLAPAHHVGDGVHLSPVGAGLMAASLRAALASAAPSTPAMPGGSPPSPAARQEP